MSRNWLEELVAEYYRYQGYLVATDVDLPMPIKGKRKVGGHSDIDVLAVNKEEIIHIECKSWWGPDKVSETYELDKLKEKYDVSKKHIIKIYPFLKEIKIFNRILVTSGKPNKPRGGPWARLDKYCNENEIKLIEINEILNDFINLIDNYLKKNKPKGVIGKHESFVTRLLIHMVSEGYLDKKLE